MSAVYTQRINVVLDHIRANVMETLSLETLASVAGFSAYHFHRLFTSLTGETVNQCVIRLRVERAAALMRADPACTVSDAAYDAGFASLSDFSRVFKKHYGIAPTKWDRQATLQMRKNRQTLDGFPIYTVEELRERERNGEFPVTIQELPARRVVVLRVTDPYQPDRVLQAYDRLCAWIRARGGDPETMTLIGMSQDDPTITPLSLCRYDWCFIPPPPMFNGYVPAAAFASWEADTDIVVREFPACKIASIHVDGDIMLVHRVWQYLYRRWLPNSRYLPDNRPAMEIFRRQPSQIGWLHYDIDCVIPIVEWD